jgi:hypothetical protein
MPNSVEYPSIGDVVYSIPQMTGFGVTGPSQSYGDQPLCPTTPRSLAVAIDHDDQPFSLSAVNGRFGDNRSFRRVGADLRKST